MHLAELQCTPMHCLAGLSSDDVCTHGCVHRRVEGSTLGCGVLNTLAAAQIRRIPIEGPHPYILVEVNLMGVHRQLEVTSDLCHLLQLLTFDRAWRLHTAAASCCCACRICQATNYAACLLSWPVGVLPVSTMTLACP